MTTLNEQERCICNTRPGTDGPDETCPQHGRRYAYWVEWCGVLETRLAKVEALADEWEHPAEVYALRMSAAPRLRAALASDPTHTQDGAQA